MRKQLVMIPALLCDEDMYADVIVGLVDKVSAEVMMSPKPDLAESVADILARAPETFALAGTSYGGALALEIAIAAPERVSELILMGVGGDAPDQAQILGMAEMVAQNFDAALGFLAGGIVHRDATEAREFFIAMAHRVGAVAGADEARALAGRAAVWDRLAQLTMPCLVIWGAEDALVPVADGRKLAEALPHAHFYAIPGCGHLPTLEKPAQVIAIIQDFFEGEHHHHH